MKAALAKLVHNLVEVLERPEPHPGYAISRTSRHLPTVYVPRFAPPAAPSGAGTGAPSGVPSAGSMPPARLDRGIGVQDPRVLPLTPRIAATSVNMRCTHCSDRIYAVRRYRIDGRLPILVLRYNYPLDEKSPAHPDRSAKGLFATPDEDDLFSRMIQAAGLQIEDLHFQEFPACHFDPRGLPEDWNARTRACLEHVQTTVRERSIRHVLVTGAAAVLLFGEDAAALAEKGESIPMQVIEPSVPCLVVRSPAALLAMEKQRMTIEKGLERFPEERQLYETLKVQPGAFKQWADDSLAAILSGSAWPSPSGAPAGAQAGTASASPSATGETPPTGRGESVRVVAGVRLKSAASVQAPQGRTAARKSPGEAEAERFRAAGREGAGLLFRLHRLRENEAKVKRQILSALRAVKAAAGEGGTSV